MTNYLRRTELWEVTPTGQRHLMNTIMPGSRYRSLETPKDLHLEENQLKVARDLRDGWKLNGQKPVGTRFEIVQVWSDGSVKVVS